MTVLIPGLYGLDAATAWRTFSKDPQKYLDRFEKDKTVQKEIEYFNKKAPTLKSVDDLFKDRRLLQFVLDSYGLGEEINNVGRIKKILTEDPTASGALSSRLADGRFAAMAKNLRLDLNLNAFTVSVKRETMTDKYVSNEFEVNLGEQDPALRQAAYMARNASSISDVYSILGDKILRDVVTTTFNIPKQLAIQPVETQAAAIARRLDVTKFKTDANSTVTKTQLDRAKSDFDLLETNLAISDAAVNQIKTLSAQLNQLTTNYANLTANTDTGGANAATIALQEVAVPELVRFDQLLTSGDEAVDNIKSRLETLAGYIEDAKKTGTNLVTLKANFDSVISSINSAITNASITAPDGSTQNILLNGSADQVSVVFNDQGDEITINRYDATGLQGILAQAQSAFDSITGSGDSTNIYAAQGRLLVAIDQIGVIGDQIDTDIEGLADGTNGKPFYATLNSTDLLKGKASVDDALSRITQIEDLLEQIGDVATESKNRLPSADRTDLQAEFVALRDQVRDLIQNAGDPSFDNFLNNIPDTNYEIINGQNIGVKGNFDLLTDIMTDLDAADVLNVTNATALEITAIQVTVSTDQAKDGLSPSKPFLDKIVEKYDPRASLDTQILALKEQISAAITAADVGGKNLLSANQSNIKLGAMSTGHDITFRAQSTFEVDVLDKIDDLLAELGNGASAIASALEDVLYVVDSAKRKLEADNRTATLEQGKLGGVIDVLEPNDTSDTENPYKVNAFTEKFLVRYLTQVQLNNGTSTNSNSYIATLFGGASSSQNAIGNIMSLSLQI